MKRVILVFTVMLICMMASSAFSTEARPYDPLRPRLSPGGDDDPWDYPKAIEEKSFFFANNYGPTNGNAEMLSIITNLKLNICLTKPLTRVKNDSGQNKSSFNRSRTTGKE
jgi:hypothetical protein